MWAGSAGYALQSAEITDCEERRGGKGHSSEVWIALSPSYFGPPASIIYSAWVVGLARGKSGKK